MVKVTLANLAEATPQEVFDQIATHLLRQGRECMVNGRCFYRYGDMACAAGVLIGENEYDREKMETKNWTSLVRELLVPSAHQDLISELQYIHDTKSPIHWRKLLREEAKKHGLSDAKVPPDKFDGTAFNYVWMDESR